MFEFKKSTKFMTAFAGSIESIKGYLCDIGNTYLLICYNVWEIDFTCSYSKAGYKSTVEAMEKELGFKKSTTYNMIKVVKTYGTNEKGLVSFEQLTAFSKFSYSQLVEMLSLGSEQREKVTPETPVSAIRMLKKSEKDPAPEVHAASEAPSASAPVAEEFQTSGKSIPICVRTEVLETVSLNAPERNDIDFRYSIDIEDGELCCVFDIAFEQYLDRFGDDICDLAYDLSPRSVNYFRDFSRYDPDDLEERFSTILSVYRSAYNAYKKHQDLKDNSAV